jgi:hypothetical protein
VWAPRDFLLFIPAGTPNLRAVLSYYSSTATVNPEGDVNINDSLQGLGNYHHFRNTPFYDTLINTYICSSNTLLAMAFIAVLASSPTLHEDFGVEDIAEDGIELQNHRFGNCSVPAAHSSIAPISDCVWSAAGSHPHSCDTDHLLLPHYCSME